MKTIYLVRHGKASLEGSDLERGLTAEGLEQARQLADVLKGLAPKIEQVYSSSFARAVKTAEPFAEMGAFEIKKMENLREKKMSTEPIANLNEERQKAWEDFNYKLPGGESGHEAQARALSALESIRDEMADGSAVVVISHGNLIGHIVKSIDAEFGFDQWRSMTMPDIFQICFGNEGDMSEVRHIGCEGVKTFKIGG